MKHAKIENGDFKLVKYSINANYPHKMLYTMHFSKFKECILLLYILEDYNEKINLHG